MKASELKRATELIDSLGALKNFKHASRLSGNITYSNSMEVKIMLTNSNQCTYIHYSSGSEVEKLLQKILEIKESRLKDALKELGVEYDE